MKITFDTNIMLHNTSVATSEKYSEYERVILLPVISELDHIKTSTENANLKYLARKASRRIIHGIDAGIFTMLEVCSLNNNPISLDKYSVIDDLIITMCREHTIKLVTMDINVFLKAKACGVDTELITTQDKVENLSMVYKGKKKCYIYDRYIDMLYKDKVIDAHIIVDEFGDAVEFNENECVTLLGSSSKVLTIYKDGFLHMVKRDDKVSYWGAKPKDDEQRYALSLLTDDSIRIVTMTGCAGTAKSFLSFAVGLEKKVNSKLGKGSLYIARPPVSLSKRLQLGFKKGTTIDKAIGSLGSYSTNLERLAELKGDNKIDGMTMLTDLLEQCQVKYLNIEDILGMSFCDEDYIIIDEAELLTKEEMKAIVTRGGKIIVIGDVLQGGDSKVDYEDSGLLHLIEVGKQSPLIAHITLENIHRSEIVAEINKIW